MSILQSRDELIVPDWRGEFKRLEGAFAPSTIKCYFTDIRDFEEWCCQAQRSPFPADVETVCEYLAQLSPKVTPATVRRRSYAIAKAHRLLRLPNPIGDEEVNITIRRVWRSKPGRPKQAKGLTADYLAAFIEAQPDTPWGLRDRAMLSVGYDILARRSELVAITTNEVTVQGDGTLRILVRRSKSDPFGMGRLAWTSRRSGELVQEWLKWRGGDIQPLFCAIYQGKAIDRTLSGDSVRDLIKRSARMAQIDQKILCDFSGHSLRVGAAQDLLSKGLDTAAIMRAGGWKSFNVLARYLEYAEHNVWG